MKNFILLLITLLSASTVSFGQEVPEKQQIVISKIGATWCPNCGLQAWDNFDELNSQFADQAVILSLHPSQSSRLHAPEASEFSDNLPQAWGQPLFYINRTKYGTNDIIKGVGDEIANANNVSPTANTGIIARINGQKLEVAAKVKFFQEGNGDYYLSLYAVENDVIETQSQRGSEAVHKKILRTSLLEGTFGQAFANGTVNANSEYSFTAINPIEAGWNTDNLEVAAVIWNKIGDEYEFVNANTVNAEFSTSVNYLEQTGVQLLIMPNLIKNSAIINIETPSAIANVDIAVFNTSGQEILSVYNGSLQNGTQQFQLEKRNLLSSGIYFLKLEANGSVINKKFIVE